MSEGAIVSILTLDAPIDVRSAKLSLILVRVIKLLYSVVSFLTLFAIVAFPPFEDLITYL